MTGSPDALVRLRQQEVAQLAQEDPVLWTLLGEEYRRQADVLTMVAPSSIADPSVLACEAGVATNVTAEGYPGARFHAGCAVVDEIERLAITRARAAFGVSCLDRGRHG